MVKCNEKNYFQNFFLIYATPKICHIELKIFTLWWLAASFSKKGIKSFQNVIYFLNLQSFYFLNQKEFLWTNQLIKNGGRLKTLYFWAFYLSNALVTRCFSLSSSRCLPKTELETFVWVLGIILAQKFVLLHCFTGCTFK